MNAGIAAGASGTFLAELLDNGSPLAHTEPPFVPAFTWSADDTTVVLTPTADTTGCQVDVPAGDVGTSFTLTVTCTDPEGGSANGTLMVPITAVPQKFTIQITQTA